MVEVLEKEVRKYRRASAQRLTTAEFLFRQGLYIDSTYIAGYVVECALKALILARCPQGGRTAMRARLVAGKRGHDFEYLKGILRQLGCLMPLDIAQELRRIATWSTDYRYEVGLGDHEEALGFLDAARAIREWVERSL